MSTPPSPLLSPSQLAALADIGEERSAAVDELLYRVGDRSYPFAVTLQVRGEQRQGCAWTDKHPFTGAQQP